MSVLHAIFIVIYIEYTPKSERLRCFRLFGVNLFHKFVHIRWYFSVKLGDDINGQESDWHSDDSRYVELQELWQCRLEENHVHGGNEAENKAGDGSFFRHSSPPDPKDKDWCECTGRNGEGEGDQVADGGFFYHQAKDSV